LVLLLTMLMPLAVLGSYRYITRRERAFYANMLLLETGVVGAFMALDMFLFFVFFELMLVPMYFIIAIWGGERRVYGAIKFFLFFVFVELMLVPMCIIVGNRRGERRVYAAIKFFLFTGVGSLLMLVRILCLFFKHRALTGDASFAYFDLLRVPLTFTEQYWLF